MKIGQPLRTIVAEPVRGKLPEWRRHARNASSADGIFARSPLPQVAGAVGASVHSITVFLYSAVIRAIITSLCRSFERNGAAECYLNSVSGGDVQPPMQIQLDFGQLVW